MTDGRGKKIAEQASASGERHGRDLQKVNERLKELVSSLKAQQERRAEARPPAPAAAVASASASAAYDVPAVDLEKKRLGAELALAREAIDHAQAERDRLQQRLAEIEAENQRICDEYVAVEERSSEMAQQLVALERLHGGLTRAETITALQEIVINVIGTEELAVFEVRDDALALVHSFGIDPGPLRAVAIGAGAIGGAARSGAIFVAGRGGETAPAERDLTAAIPLRVGDRVQGVIAIFRLLGHKPGLGDSDHAVFDLLAAHAGLALHLRAPERRAVAG
jgi:hypothetical protein